MRVVLLFSYMPVVICKERVGTRTPIMQVDNTCSVRILYTRILCIFLTPMATQICTEIFLYYYKDMTAMHYFLRHTYTHIFSLLFCEKFF